MNFLALVRADVVAHVPPAERNMPAARWVRVIMKIAVRSSGFHVMLLHRLAHAALGWPGGGRAVGALIFWLIRHGYGCALAPSARLGGGIMLPHPQGIVIGGEVVVGARAFIFQNVTIGGSPGKSGQPRIGTDARIYAGAVISGPVTLGDNVMVGANAVVSQDVDSRMGVRAARVDVFALPEQFLAPGETPSGNFID